MAGDDLRHCDDSLLERARALVGMAVDLDPEEHRQTEPDALAAEHGAIALDVSVVLKPPHAPQAGRGRKADAIGELEITQPPIRLQRGEDPAVDRIELSFWHDRLLLEPESAISCQLVTNYSSFRKDSSRPLASQVWSQGDKQCPTSRRCKASTRRSSNTST